MLAHVICGEAAELSRRRAALHRFVVLNRRNSGRYQVPIKGVVIQPGEYSSTRDGNYYPARPPRPAGLTPGGCWRTAALLPGNCGVPVGRTAGKGRLSADGVSLLLLLNGAPGECGACGRERLGGLRRARSCTATSASGPAHRSI